MRKIGFAFAALAAFGLALPLAAPAKAEEAAIIIKRATGTGIMIVAGTGTAITTKWPSSSNIVIGITTTITTRTVLS